MAKKPVTKNNQINKTQKNQTKTPVKTRTNTTTKTNNATKKPAAKKTPPKEPKEKILDNLSILKSSPYINVKSKGQLNQKKLTLKDLFEKNLLLQKEEKLEIVLTGQYEKALDLMFEADASNLYPILVGPPGIGKHDSMQILRSVESRNHGK